MDSKCFNSGFGISYSRLVNWMWKGIRNGNWRKLSIQERALFRAAIWYAKFKRIVSSRIIILILNVAEKLLSTIRAKIFKLGLARAAEMLVAYEEKGVFNLFPRLKIWLVDPDYIFWLGASYD